MVGLRQGEGALQITVYTCVFLWRNTQVWPEKSHLKSATTNKKNRLMVAWHHEPFFFFFPCKILCFLSPLIKSFSKSLHLLHLSSLSQMWSKATTSFSDERSFPLSQTEGQGGWLTLHPLDSFDHLVFEESLVGFNKNISNEVWRAWFGLFFAESNLARALLIGTILQSQFQSG